MNNRDFDNDVYEIPSDENRGGSYTVQSINMSNKTDKANALKEMQIQQNRCIADYKEWANSTLNYKSLSNLSDSERTRTLSQRLKESNDAYTVGLITSSLSPLQSGVDGKTILQTMISYKIMQTMNPSMNMDTSRMLANFRNAITPMLENHKILSKLAAPIDDIMMKSSIDKENEAISEGLENNDIDSLVMTPRQLAAIKMNFMEQYYVDTRALDPSSKTYEDDLYDLTQMYDTSLQHVRAIAENSGYDMSVVASEERYLVGLKMLNEPDSCYEAMFEETNSIYGVCPDLTNDGDDAIWQGDFKSSDGHVYSANRDDYNGSFTVRKPLMKSDLPEFKENLCRQGQQYAWMQQYLESDECPASKAAKKKALNILSDKYDNYKNRVSAILQDDLDMSKKQAESIINETFTTNMNNELKTDKTEAFTKVDDPFTKANTQSIPGSDFFRELRYVEEKKIYKNLGINISMDDDASRNNIINEIAQNAKMYYESQGDIDDRDFNHIATDMVNNDIEKLTADELVELMTHVGTNMEQGWQKRGSYSRYGEPSLSDEKDAPDFDFDEPDESKNKERIFDVDEGVKAYNKGASEDGKDNDGDNLSY